MEQPNYSVIIPVFNSGPALRDLVDRIESVFNEIVRDSYEIILVDDGSKDKGTRETLGEIVSAKLGVQVVTFTRNFGKPAALLCGFAESRGQFVITMDDDLQHLPEDIPKLLEASDHDVVMGRFDRKKHGLLTRMGSGTKAWFDVVILKIPERCSPFQLIRREIADAMVRTQSSRPFIPALIMAVTDDIVSVPVQHEASRAGKSRYSLRRRIRQFLDLLIGNSSLALRFIGVVGILVAVAGFIYAGILITQVVFLGADPPPGWASLMVALLILNGLVLVSTAISGEYFIRILNNTGGRPLYVVRHKSTENAQGSRDPNPTP